MLQSQGQYSFLLASRAELISCFMLNFWYICYRQNIHLKYQVQFPLRKMVCARVCICMCMREREIVYVYVCVHVLYEDCGGLSDCICACTGSVSSTT